MSPMTYNCLISRNDSALFLIKEISFNFCVLWQEVH